MNGGDAAYDIDFPRAGSSACQAIAQQGRYYFSKAINTEYNGRAGDPGRKDHPKKVLASTLGYQRSSWGGNAVNPYDTTRAASLGSSSGSALSVSVDLVMASLGEETRASPAVRGIHNAIALILPHKALLGFNGGAIGADVHCDRTGISARTLIDCAKILDALKDADNGYYDARDPFTTVPRSSVMDRHLRQFRRDAGQRRRAGRHADRCYPRVHDLSRTKTEQPIVSAAAREIKRSCSARSSVRRWLIPAYLVGARS